MSTKINAEKLAKLIDEDAREAQMLGCSESEWRIGTVGKFAVMLKLVRLGSCDDPCAAKFRCITRATP